jgi:putative transposase
LQDRATGWLTPEFHRIFREQLMHVLHRQPCICPVYCLMPDHHMVLVGLAARTQQLTAIQYLRGRLGSRLAPLRLQSQAYDHVLRPDEKFPERFSAICGYIRDNPVRKGWIGEWSDWPYTDSLALGYGDLDSRAPDFWIRYFRVLETEVERYGSMEAQEREWIEPGTAGYLR